MECDGWKQQTIHYFAETCSLVTHSLIKGVDNSRPSISCPKNSLSCTEIREWLKRELKR